MESISSILQWLWGTRASAQRRSLFGRMTHLSKYDVWNRWGNSLLYTLRELIFYWCTPLFITDMPSEKATVSSKSSKTSRRRNLLSLTLELKVMWTLFCRRLLIWKFPLYCSLDVFLFCRNLWRFLAWGEVSEWPGVLWLGEHGADPSHRDPAQTRKTGLLFVLVCFSLFSSNFTNTYFLHLILSFAVFPSCF